MPKKEYGWAGGNVPIIGEHSLAKHRILREYVQRYIEILTQNPRIDRLRLTLVDAFAGGGIYQRSGHDAPHLGSPAGNPPPKSGQSSPKLTSGDRLRRLPPTPATRC
jgi:hypothetical protein